MLQQAVSCDYATWRLSQNEILLRDNGYTTEIYFLPDFLMPPVARGPFPPAFFAISANFFFSSCWAFWKKITRIRYR